MTPNARASASATASSSASSTAAAGARSLRNSAAWLPLVAVESRDLRVALPPSLLPGPGARRAAFSAATMAGRWRRCTAAVSAAASAFAVAPRCISRIMALRWPPAAARLRALLRRRRSLLRVVDTEAASKDSRVVKEVVGEFVQIFKAALGEPRELEDLPESAVVVNGRCW